MPTPMETARRFQDLMSLESHDVPYLFDKIFSAEGWRARSLSKKKFKLLKKIDSQVRAMLREGEKVYFITWGVESSLLESFFVGQIMYYINRAAFVFTTERILLLQISVRNKPLHLKSQIEYLAIAKIGRTMLGNCKIKFQSGKTSVFEKVPKGDRKFMQEVIEHLRSGIATRGIDIKEKENLCPRCYAAVEGFPLSCSHCDKPFKSANKAAWLSLIFPGLGKLYLGVLRTFAVFEIVVVSLAWVFWFGFVIQEERPEVVLVLLEVLAFFVTLHGIAAIVTRHIGRKGIYPSGK